MRKLSATDAAFLYSETEHTPNTIAAVQILELPENMDADAFLEQLSEHYSDRMHLLPYLYSKVRFAPGNIDHPVWVTDPDFSIDNHVYIEELPAPGSMLELENRVAEIHAEILDRNKPLWRLVIFKGLKNPRQIAYYSASHHACLDGIAGTAATEIMMDDVPELVKIAAPEKFPPEDHDTAAELWRLSVENLIKSQISMPLRILDMAEALEHLAERTLRPERHFGAYAQRAPRTQIGRAHV